MLSASPQQKNKSLTSELWYEKLPSFKFAQLQRRK